MCWTCILAWRGGDLGVVNTNSFLLMQLLFLFLVLCMKELIITPASREVLAWRKKPEWQHSLCQKTSICLTEQLVSLQQTLLCLGTLLGVQCYISSLINQRLLQVVLWSLADHVSSLSVHDQGTFDGKREKLSCRSTLKVSHKTRRQWLLYSIQLSKRQA